MNFEIYACCLPKKIMECSLGVSLGVLFNSCPVLEDQPGLHTMACSFLEHFWPLNHKEFFGRNFAKPNLPLAELC